MASIELFRMPESEAVRVGLGVILQSHDGIRTVRSVSWKDYGTRCEFSDGSWRTVRRKWIPEEYRYRYWAKD